MNLLHMLPILTGLVTFVSTTGGDTERCKFPSEWKGRWYQNGLGEVIIRNKLITKKGHCFEHHRDYYLVKKRDVDCYQCLLIIERHPNLIQYKESFCLARDTLRIICAQIQVERPLYTLVRDPAIPTECPFKDAYYFDYNDQATGFCNTPISYAKPCAGHTQYQMHFKHCKEYAMFSNTDLNFECLATWKDGSDTYMYGQWSGHEIANKDESFRCFKYENFGTEMFMAMSVDATCQGLRTPRDGPVTMAFTKDIYGWPRASCSYPHWLSGVTWRDIEGKHTISFNADSNVMIDHYRRRISSEPEIQSEHRCVNVLGNEFSAEGETVTVFSFTTNNCMSKHQCLRFKRSKSGRMEVFKGVMADFDSHTECVKEEHYGEAEIWMDESAPPVECPMRGSYLMDDGEGCQKRIAIGCQNNTLLSFSSTCGSSHAFSLQCMLTWQEMGKTYLLAKEPGVTSRLVNCFSFKERSNTVHFTTDRKCGGGASGIRDKSVKYDLLEQETCEAAAAHVVLPSHSLPGGNSGPSQEESTTPAPETGAPVYMEGDNPDYYDFAYVDTNGDNANPPEVTRYPLSPNGPRDGSHRNNDRPGDNVQGDTGPMRGGVRGEPDEDSWSLAEDIASSIRNSHPPDPQSRPNPKYVQVDHSHVPAPTGVAGKEQRTSSASRCPVRRNRTLSWQIALAVIFIMVR